MPRKITGFPERMFVQCQPAWDADNSFNSSLALSEKMAFDSQCTYTCKDGLRATHSNTHVCKSGMVAGDWTNDGRPITARHRDPASGNITDGVCTNHKGLGIFTTDPQDCAQAAKDDADCAHGEGSFVSIGKVLAATIPSLPSPPRPTPPHIPISM